MTPTPLGQLDDIFRLAKKTHTLPGKRLAFMFDESISACLSFLRPTKKYYEAIDQTCLRLIEKLVPFAREASKYRVSNPPLRISVSR
jgi:hypothetical protein